MDFLVVLKSHLEGLGLFSQTVEIGSFNSDGNGICLRTTPSQSPEKDLGNSLTYHFGFQILTRHNNHITSMNEMQDIALHVNELGKNDIVSVDNSFVLIKSRLNGAVNLVEKDTHGWIYTALFNAELHIN